MNRNRNICFTLLGSAILAVLLILWFCRSGANETGNLDGRQRGQSTANAQGESQLPASDPRERERELLASKNVPIRFYGRVVDEAESPVEGAEVVFAIRSAPLAMWTSGESQPGASMTGKDGIFAISGRGESLTIKSITKAGFREPNVRTYGFSFGGDANKPRDPKHDRSNPKQFLIISQEAFSSTERIQQKLSFKWNGTSYSFNLDPRIGTITLKCERQPLAQYQQSDFRWGVDIGCQNFGVVECGQDQDVLPIAPATGYQHRVQYQSAIEGVPWRDFGEKSFFLKTADGSYGCMRLRIYAAREDDSVNGSIDIHLTAGASRVVDHE